MPSLRPPKAAVAARMLLVPYVVAVAMIVWLPAAVASRVTGVAFRLAEYASAHLGISLSTSYTVFEFLANVALFIPFGLLLAAGWPRLSPWLVILTGYAASATIELVQTLLPSRYPTLSDVIANTLGTILGCLLVRVAVGLRPRPRAVQPSSPAG